MKLPPYTMQDILQGGYPPVFAAVTQNGTNVLNASAVPANVRRVYLIAEGYGNADAQRLLLSVIRRRVSYQIAHPEVGRVNAGHYVGIGRPLTLDPGDVLSLSDDAATNNNLWLYVGYVDIIMPPKGGLIP